MNAEDKREAPSNIELEQALLGCILVENGAFRGVEPFLKPEHFHERIHQKIYNVAAELIRMGKPANPVTVKSFLPGREKVGNDMTVNHYLAALAANAMPPMLASEYGRAIFDLAQLRIFIRTCEDAADKAYALSVELSPQALLDETQQALGNLYVMPTTRERPKSNRIGENYVAGMRQAQTKQKVVGVHIGFDELAAVLSEPCLEAGNLYGLLASSGEGKTSFMLQIAYEALKAGHPVMIQSFDQRVDQFMRQLCAQNLSIEARRQRYATDLKEEEWADIERFAGWIDHQPFGVVKCTAETAPQLVGYARKFCRTHHVDPDKKPLVITDHIGGITPPESTDKRDEGKKAIGVCQIIKAGAEECDAAWLMINQRNSKGMMRPNPRPIMADLYGGEGARQPYDSIAYLYRFRTWFLLKKAIMEGKGSEWEKFRKLFPAEVVDESADIAEIGVIKSRFGSVDITKRVDFQGKFTRYISRDAPVANAVPEEVDQLGFGGL